MTRKEMPWAKEATEIFNSFLSGSFLNRAKAVDRINEIIGAAYHTSRAEAIEECAKGAEEMANESCVRETGKHHLREYANRLRALKGTE